MIPPMSKNQSRKHMLRQHQIIRRRTPCPWIVSIKCFLLEIHLLIGKLTTLSQKKNITKFFKINFVFYKLTLSFSYSTDIFSGSIVILKHQVKVEDLELLNFNNHLPKITTLNVADIWQALFYLTQR